MASASGWKLVLATLALGLPAGMAMGQEFVVRDRFVEARERVLREREAAQATPAALPDVVETQLLPVDDQALDLAIAMPAESYTMIAPVEVAAAVVQEPASPVQSPSVWQPIRENEVWNETAGEGAWVTGPEQAATGRAAWGELEPGPYDYSWRRDIPGVVLTNTHWFDGPRGEGYAAPFGYTSAYCRSGTGPQQDARGNPSFCDEWKSPCGCDCCDEPFGLDVFKSRPWGPWPQKKHDCGCQTQCNGCAEGTCGGTAGEFPGGIGRLGFLDEPLISIR